MTLNEIREDLREIKFYYSMKKTFDSSEVRSVATLNKVDKYNKIMESAPAKLYILYVELYINNNTQTSLADMWCYSREYIQDIHTKMCEYIQKNLRDNNE